MGTDVQACHKVDFSPTNSKSPFRSQFLVPVFFSPILLPALIVKSSHDCGVDRPIYPAPGSFLQLFHDCVSLPLSIPDFFLNPLIILCFFVNPLIFPIIFCIILVIQFFRGFISDPLISHDSFLTQLVFLILYDINQFIPVFLYSNEGPPIFIVPISDAPIQRFFLCSSLNLPLSPDSFLSLPIILYSSSNHQISLQISITPILACSASANPTFLHSALTAQILADFVRVHQAIITFLGCSLNLERIPGFFANPLIFLLIV